MKYIVYTIIFFLSFCKTSNCQTDNLKPSVIFFANKNTYLLPYIEEKLKSLKNARTKQNIFSKVRNFNRIYDDRIIHKLFTKEAINRSSENSIYNLTPNSIVYNDTLSREIQSYDLFIVIEITPLTNNVEYQLSVYRTLPKDRTRSFNSIPTNNVTSEYRTVSFLLNTNEKSYELIIDKNIQKLFPETNIPPIAIITSDHDTTEYVQLGLNDSLLLDATNSFDNDTPPEELSYKWRLIESSDLSTITPRISLPFVSVLSKQLVPFNQLGKYKIGLKVYDGIEYSREDTLLVDIVKRPNLYTNTKKIYLEIERYLFGHKVINENIFVGTDDKYNSSLVALINNDTIDYSPVLSIVKDVDSLSALYLVRNTGLKINTPYYNRKISFNNSYKYQSLPLLITKSELTKEVHGNKLYKINLHGSPPTGDYELDLFMVKKKVLSSKHTITISIINKSTSRFNLNMNIIPVSFWQYRYNINSSNNLSIDSSIIYKKMVGFELFDFQVNLFKFLSVGTSLFGVNNVAQIKYNNYDDNIGTNVLLNSQKYGPIFETVTQTYVYTPNIIYILGPFLNFTPSVKLSFYNSLSTFTNIIETKSATSLNIKPLFLNGCMLVKSFHHKKIPLNLSLSIYSSLLDSYSTHVFGGFNKAVLFNPYSSFFKFGITYQPFSY